MSPGGWGGEKLRHKEILKAQIKKERKRKCGVERAEV
jgi:hypothetical protein